MTMTKSEKRRQVKDKKKAKEVKDRKIRDKKVRMEKKRKEVQIERKITPNARVIQGLMRSRNVKGDYREYVVLTGNSLVDWKGSHTLSTSDGKVIGVKEMALVHKRNLKNFLPSEIAERFWHPKLGTLGAKNN